MGKGVEYLFSPMYVWMGKPCCLQFPSWVPGDKFQLTKTQINDASSEGQVKDAFGINKYPGLLSNKYDTIALPF